ncbi:hypothetical protein OH76DRAFT_157287 [Lentinus brumalis]|uniref:Uncharacterized protein n=1 Tax=Lentinus brumalis TaxID=2498619 RepID=A0A371DIU2_9APHY|nr:hypothetical protein OH76DRAFT_157287 [Polyporus brumalis]
MGMKDRDRRDAEREYNDEPFFAVVRRLSEGYCIQRSHFCARKEYSSDICFLRPQDAHTLAKTCSKADPYALVQMTCHLVRATSQNSSSPWTAGNSTRLASLHVNRPVNRLPRGDTAKPNRPQNSSKVPISLRAACSLRTAPKWCTGATTSRAARTSQPRHHGWLVAARCESGSSSCLNSAQTSQR